MKDETSLNPWGLIRDLRKDPSCPWAYLEENFRVAGKKIGSIKLDIRRSFMRLMRKTVPGMQGPSCAEGAGRDGHCHAPQGDETEVPGEWFLPPESQKSKRP